MERIATGRNISGDTCLVRMVLVAVAGLDSELQGSEETCLGTATIQSVYNLDGLIVL